MEYGDALKTYKGTIHKAAVLNDKGIDVVVRERGRSVSKLAHHSRYLAVRTSDFCALHGTKILQHQSCICSPLLTWGVNNEGTSELARCLLMDIFGSSPCPDFPNPCTCENKWIHESLYEGFKISYVEKWPANSDWKVEQQEILDWAFDFIHDITTTTLEQASLN